MPLHLKSDTNIHVEDRGGDVVARFALHPLKMLAPEPGAQMFELKIPKSELPRLREYAELVVKRVKGGRPTLIVDNLGDELLEEMEKGNIEDAPGDEPEDMPLERMHRGRPSIKAFRHGKVVLAAVTTRQGNASKTWAVAMAPGDVDEVQKRVEDWMQKTNAKVAEWHSLGGPVYTSLGSDAPVEPTFEKAAAAAAPEPQPLKRLIDIGPDDVLPAQFSTEPPKPMTEKQFQARIMDIVAAKVPPSQAELDNMSVTAVRLNLPKVAAAIQQRKSVHYPDATMLSLGDLQAMAKRPKKLPTPKRKVEAAAPAPKPTVSPKPVYRLDTPVVITASPQKGAFVKPGIYSPEGPICNPASFDYDPVRCKTGAPRAQALPASQDPRSVDYAKPGPHLPAAYDPRSVDFIPFSNLKRGSSGAEVLELQKKLAAAGFPPGALDGKFGPDTEAAVKAFQRAKTQDAVRAGRPFDVLKDDGVVGPQTAIVLNVKLPGATFARKDAPIVLGDSPGWSVMGQAGRGISHCLQLPSGKIVPTRIFHCQRGETAMGALLPGPHYVTREEASAIVGNHVREALIGELMDMAPRATAAALGYVPLTPELAVSVMGAAYESMGAGAPDLHPPKFVDDALHEDQMALFAKAGPQGMDIFRQDEVFGDEVSLMGRMPEIVEPTELFRSPEMELRERILSAAKRPPANTIVRARDADPSTAADPSLMGNSISFNLGDHLALMGCGCVSGVNPEEIALAAEEFGLGDFTGYSHPMEVGWNPFKKVASVAKKAGGAAWSATKTVARTAAVPITAATALTTAAVTSPLMATKWGRRVRRRIVSPMSRFALSNIKKSVPGVLVRRGLTLAPTRKLGRFIKRGTKMIVPKYIRKKAEALGRKIASVTKAFIPSRDKQKAELVQHLDRKLQLRYAKSAAWKRGSGKPSPAEWMQAKAFSRKLLGKHGLPINIMGDSIAGVAIVTPSMLGLDLYDFNPMSWFRSKEVNALYRAQRDAEERKEQAEKLRPITEKTKRMWGEVNEIERNLENDILSILEAQKARPKTSLAGITGDEPEPYIVVGAWWNPFSWFAKKEEAVLKEADLIVPDAENLPPLPPGAEQMTPEEQQAREPGPDPTQGMTPEQIQQQEAEQAQAAEQAPEEAAEYDAQQAAPQEEGYGEPPLDAVPPEEYGEPPPEEAMGSWRPV